MAAKTYFFGNVKRETEKAILVEYCYAINFGYNGDDKHFAHVWLPKSQIKVYREVNDGTVWLVPAWLANKNNLTTMTKKIADMLVA